MNRSIVVVMLVVSGMLAGSAANAADTADQQAYNKCVLTHIGKARTKQAIETIKEACRNLHGVTQRAGNARQGPQAAEPAQARVATAHKVPASVIHKVDASNFQFSNKTLEVTLTNHSRLWTLTRYDLIFINPPGRTGQAQFTRARSQAMRGTSGAKFRLTESLAPRASKTFYLDISNRGLYPPDSYQWRLLNVYGYRQSGH